MKKLFSKSALIQWAIIIFSASSIFMVNTPQLMKFAPITGLLAQPFWFYTTYKHKQWGPFALSFWFTACWTIGFYNNFIG
jgi:hypothetical protein